MDSLLLEKRLRDLEQRSASQRQEILRLENENKELREQMRADKNLSSMNERRSFALQQKLQQELEELRAQFDSTVTEHNTSSLATLQQQEMDFLTRERQLCERLESLTEELAGLKTFSEQRDKIAADVMQLKQQMAADEAQHQQQVSELEQRLHEGLFVLFLQN